MLILYYHFYVTNCTNNLYFVDFSVSVSVNSNINGPSTKSFLLKTSILVFTVAAGFITRLGNIKLNFLAPKGSSNSDILNI